MLRYISIAGISIAGAGHLLIAPEHFSHAFAHGLFFALTGLAQLAWAIAFWRLASPVLYWPGLVLSGGALVLWALTWMLSVPFAPDADAIDLIVVLIKSTELIGFLALVVLDTGYHLEVGTRWPVQRLVAGGLLVPVVFGVAAWGGGHLVEALSAGLGYGPGHGSADGPTARAEDQPVPGPTPDVQAMIAAAVEAALGSQPASTPAPSPSSDIQAMIAAAVEDALANQPAPTPAPGPAPEDVPVSPTPTIASTNGPDNSDRPGLVSTDEATPTIPEAMAPPAPTPTSPPEPTAIPAPTAQSSPGPTAAPAPTRWPLTDPWMSEPEPDPDPPRWQKPLFLGVIGILAVIAAIAVLRNW